MIKNILDNVGKIHGASKVLGLEPQLIAGNSNREVLG